jgi:hypothetical protein
MPPVAIPPWNAEGILPPIDAVAPTSANRAPYGVSLSDLVLRFSTSPERIAILTGFLNYRAALHAARLTSGFQWVNGSFMEQVEICPRRHRPPNDVDVVTFYHLPAGATQATVVAAAPALFPSTAAEHDALKATYRVDAYPISLGTPSDRLVNRSAYWYGLWAHQRDTLKWKGFLQLDLAPAEDAAARLLLTATPPAATTTPAPAATATPAAAAPPTPPPTPTP